MSKIEVRDLKYSYENGIEVLKGISLTFDQISTAIIGQNGAGKTTFVKLLKGLLKPSSGCILINGKDTQDTTVAELSKDIGLVFQNPNDQIFKSKVIDEIMFGPLNIGQSPEKAKSNAEQALEMVGLEDRRYDNPYDLNLSDRKLVGLASVIAMDPEILILDEPTIAQDYAGKEKIKGIIKKLQDQGKLILTIIHDMDFVAETFERVVVFNQGKVLLEGNTREVFNNSRLLKEAGLESPHVTQLGKKLGYNQTFLTVEELVQGHRVRQGHGTRFLFHQ
jgi:energy-coupling factor transport system ATP-binding protein